MMASSATPSIISGLAQPDPTYRWKTRTHDFLKPEDMTTHHVFFTLRMIWNHRMPEEARLRPYNQYVFSDFYSDRYLELSIRNLALELAQRPDLLPEWKAILEQMITYLKTAGTKLQAQPEALPHG